MPCLYSPWFYTHWNFSSCWKFIYERGQKLVFEELEEQGGNYEGDKNHTDPPPPPPQIHTVCLVSEWSNVYFASTMSYAMHITEGLFSAKLKLCFYNTRNHRYGWMIFLFSHFREYVGEIKFFAIFVILHREFFTKNLATRHLYIISKLTFDYSFQGTLLVGG